MYGRHKTARVFRVESELGSGGGSVVYKAWHRRLKMYVAIKETPRSAHVRPDPGRNESEALKSIKCAYIPQVFDFLIEKERCFTVMEFIGGESFDKLLERGVRFSAAQVIKWYAQLSYALEIIHAQGIFHRDIKPSNIMLADFGDACLIDFNAALVGGNNAGSISRSLCYASPEQNRAYEFIAGSCKASTCALSGSRAEAGGGDRAGSAADGDAVSKKAEAAAAVTEDSKTVFGFDDNLLENAFAGGGGLPAAEEIDWARSDIYSLGAAMYHILTGQKPPRRTSAHTALFRHRRKGRLERIIEKSMRPDPAGRFDSATALSASLRRLEKSRFFRIRQSH